MGIRNRTIHRSLSVIGLITVLVTNAFLCWYWDLRWRPGFDDWWHAWYASIQPTSFALDELLGDSHPPVQYLALRLAPHGSMDWYRMIGCACSLGAAATFWDLTRRWSRSSLVATLLGLSLVVQPTWIAAGLTVRGCSMGLLLFAIALRSVICYLDPEDPKARLTGFFVAGMGLLPITIGVGSLAAASLGTSLLLVSLLLHFQRGEHRPMPHPIAVAVGFLGTGAFLWWWIALNRPDPTLWLNSHLMPEKGFTHWWWSESWARQWELFLPYRAPGLPLHSSNLPFAIAGALALLWIAKRRSERNLIIFTFLALAAATAIGACLREYPLGGKLRHQILFLPLLPLLVTPFALGRENAGVWRSCWCVLILGLWGIHGCLSYTEAPGPDEFARPGWHEVPQEDLKKLVRPHDVMLSDAFSTLTHWSRTMPADRPWVHSSTQKLPHLIIDRFDEPVGTETRTALRLRNVWRWGREDVPGAVVLADQYLPKDDPEKTRFWLWISQPLSNGGGGPGDDITLRVLETALKDRNLRIVYRMVSPYALRVAISR